MTKRKEDDLHNHPDSAMVSIDPRSGSGSMPRKALMAACAAILLLLGAASPAVAATDGPRQTYKLMCASDGVTDVLVTDIPDEVDAFMDDCLRGHGQASIATVGD